MQDINLVPDIERSDPTKARRKQIIVVVCSSILGVAVVLMIGLFMLYTLEQKKLHDLDVQKQPLETAIQGYDTQESYLRAVVAKADAAQQIINGQPPFRQIVARLLELEVSGLTYTEVNLTAPNQVVISGKAGSLNALDGFLADLTAKDFGRKTFTNIVLQSLARDDKGSYNFSIRFTYTGDNK